MNEEMKLQAIQALQKLQQVDDTEMNHIDADEILCNLLKELGYGEVVAEYEQVNKWYA